MQLFHSIFNKVKSATPLRRYTLYILLGFVFLAPYCSPKESTSCEFCHTKKVNHVILVWFKKGTDFTYIEKVREETMKLKEIKEVLEISVGGAIPSQRPMVDDTFSLGVHMSFASEADLVLYQNNPKHKTFFDKYIKGKTDKLIIYDF